MLRVVIVVAVLFFLSIGAQAQLPTAQEPGVFQFRTAHKSLNQNLTPLAPNEPFINPEKSLLKLQRQIDIQFLPAGFYPKVETETDSSKRKALRYAIAIYRDSEVGGIQGSVDVMVGLRFDTRNGALEIKYFSEYTIINPNKVLILEDRPSMAVLPEGECSVLLFFLDGTTQTLLTFEGLFTDKPQQVNFIVTDDVDAVKTDESLQKFAIFIRGGASNASLFILNTDTSLKDLETFEAVRNLPATDRVYVFRVLSGVVPYRGVNLSNNIGK